MVSFFFYNCCNSPLRACCSLLSFSIKSDWKHEAFKCATKKRKMQTKTVDAHLCHRSNDDDEDDDDDCHNITFNNSSFNMDRLIGWLNV